MISQDKPGNLCLNGSCFIIKVDFSVYGKNVMKEVNDLLVSSIGNAEERVSEYDENE